MTRVSNRNYDTLGFAGRIGAVLGGHVLLLVLVVQASPELRQAIAPIMVSLITPARPLPPSPAPTPPRRSDPKPRAVAQPVAPPRAPEPVANAITVETPVREPAPAAAVPPAPAVSAGAPPPPLVPPRFDAAYLRNPAPPYPALSRRLGEQGKVLLRVFVGADGRPQQVEIRTSSSSARLDRAAKEAVGQWRFVPARQGDQAVGGWVIVLEG
ncbi:MAG: TonB family protein [Betaproteobacteria bacterium]|nr:TonB family protein [Betaproteobacteria bacterium]